MNSHFHYPPEVFNLLVDTIPLLCRGKKDVLLFLRGAGVHASDLAAMNGKLRDAPELVNKYAIVRDVLCKVNERADSGLAARREILRRTVEFEEFSMCWPNDQLKAKGLISDLRKIVNVKDSFTRMKNERDAEHEQLLVRKRTDQTSAAEKRGMIEQIGGRLSALFAMDDKPHERGKLLEVVLNDLFKVYGIHVHEDFRRKAQDSAVVVEQIDGVIEIDGVIHLVEMKWLNAPVGVGEFLPHLSRLFMRANAHGIFISTNGYTAAVINECTNALSLKTIFLCTLKEFVLLLQRQDDLINFFKKKSRAAIIEKNPYLEIIS